MNDECKEIQEKIWNIELVIKDIKEFPQTYDSILLGLRDSGTCQTILRRKLNKLCKEGLVFKTDIPGTRFGKVIFYCVPKNYHILVESGRVGSKVYCFFSYKRVSKMYLKVFRCWQLVDGIWVEKEKNKIFFEGDVLKWI